MDSSVLWLPVILSVAAPASASDAQYLWVESKDHIGAIVHLMEWAYEDIQNECKYLKDVGYKGLLISPPTEHVMLDEASAMERYMSISLKLETRSGTAEELEKMLYYCAYKQGLRVFADLNLNSMLKSTTQGEVKGIGGSRATPSAHKYEDISEKEFHKHCKLTAKDLNDPDKVRLCEYDDLQDLDNDSETLQDKHVALMNKLIEMGVSGFRIVMAKYMYPKHLRYLYSQLRKTKYTVNMEVPLMIHDVNDLEEGIVKAKDYEDIGTHTDYTFSKLIGKFFQNMKGRDMDKLIGYGDIPYKKPLKARETERMVFLYNNLTKDSKDPEIIKPSNVKAHRMATAFILSWPYGIPLILSSYKGDSAPEYRNGNVMSPRPKGAEDAEEYECISEFNCEHRTPSTWKMVRFNEEVRSEPVRKMYGNNNTHWFAFARGDMGFAFFNAGNLNINHTFHHLPLEDGEYCDIASGDIEYNDCTGRSIIVEKKRATIVLHGDDPYGYVAFHRLTKVAQGLKRLRKKLHENEHVEWFVDKAAHGIVRGGDFAISTVKAVGPVIMDPNAGAYDVLEAAAGKKGAAVISDLSKTAGRTAVNVAKNVATNLAEAAAARQAEEEKRKAEKKPAETPPPAPSAEAKPAPKEAQKAAEPEKPKSK